MERQRLDKRQTVGILRWLDERLDNSGHVGIYRLYCMGGTKMVLSDLRQSSEDLDFLVPSYDTFRVLSTYIVELELKRKIRFDVFLEDDLPGYYYKEFEENSKKANYQFKHLDLYFIDDVDFVITKVLAGRPKDIDDISKVLSAKNISKEELIKRFRKIRFKSEKEKELKEKFDVFLSKLYK